MPAAKPEQLPFPPDGPKLGESVVVLAASSATGPTTPILDNFDRPDEDPLAQDGGQGPQWAPNDPRGPGWGDVLRVSSQQAAARNTSSNISYRPLTYAGDLEVYATVAVKPGVGNRLTLNFNVQQIGTSTWDAFYFWWREEAGTDTIGLGTVINGGTGVGYGTKQIEMSVGDKLLARRIGTRVEGWVYQSGTWTLELFGDDPLVGGSIGLGILNTTGRWDDYGGGPFVALVEPGPPPLDQSIGTCGVGIHAYSRSACRKSVNTLTGAYTTRAVDLELSGIGVPFTWSRTYTSTDSHLGAGLGGGWTHSHAVSGIEIDPAPATRAGAQAPPAGDVVVRGEDGQQIVYTRQPDGSYIGARGALSILSAVPAGGFKLVRDDQAVYLFDEAGKLTSMKDRNGQGLTFAYDGLGQLQTITDSVNRQIAVQHVGGRLTRVTLPDGRYVEYFYTSGLLTSVRDARGGTTAYGYDAGGRLTTVVDQRNRTVVRNVYDPATERVVDQYDAFDKRTQFAWDDATQTSTVTDARLNQWRDEYVANLISERTDPLGNRTVFEHDLQLNVTKVTDARNNATVMTYDARGNMLTRTAPPPLSYLEEWTYNGRNDPLTYKDGRGNVTNYDYDVSGNLTSVTQPDADGPGPLGRPQTVYGRDPAGTGLLISITDPRAKKTTFSYTNGDLTEIETQVGNRTTMGYDGSGRMRSMVDPRGYASGANPADFTWTYTYNEADQLRTQTDPLGHVTELDYDPAGNLLFRKDAKLHQTTYGYDDANRLTSVTAPDPDGGGPLVAPVTQYTYDEVGNLQTRKDANLHETVYGYDNANRLTSVTAPGNRIWTYGYDPNGNPTLLVDANGNATPAPGDGQTTYGYDVLNRLSSIDYSDATPDASFQYDGNGNRTQMTDGSGTETYVYDPLNRLTSVTRGADVFSYTYDLVNRTQATYPGGFSTSYAYDDDERLQSATSGGQATVYAYDEAANLRTTTLPSGNGYVETRSYDRAGRLTEVRNEKTGAPLANFAITPDPVGNPLSVVRTGSLPQTQTYTYDNIDRLTSVCFQAGTCPGGSDPFIRWTYDGVGNRLTEARPTGTTSYTYNVADELTQAGSTTYTYDQNGNELSAGPRSFTYDLANRLKTTNSGSSATTYSYDGDGKRLEAVGAGTPAAPTLKTPCATATGTSGSATVSKPTGTLAGDMLVVGLAFEKGSDVQVTPPSGWTLIRRTNQSSNVGYATYRKLAGASEPASYAFSLTNSPKWSIGSCAIAGANTATPIDVHNGASGSSGNPSAPSLTTTGPSRLVLAFYANKKPTTFSNYTSPAVERWDAPNVPGGLPSNALASYTQAAAGATGAKSATAGEQAEWVAQQIAIAPGPSVSRFLWDVNQGLPQLALERDANNSPIRRYVYGAGRISQSAGGDTSYFLHDALGSVVNLTSDTGASQRTLSYEPFGQVRSNTGSGPPTNLKFTGEYEDATGLYHLRARQYDPTTGRFLSRDPVAGGMAYGYASNRPTVLVDPLGLWSWSGLGHGALDLFGLVPVFGEPADLLNCGWYGAEGDRVNAALSCGAVVPVLGVAAIAAKWGRRVDAAVDAAKGAPSTVRHYTTAERAAQIQKSGEIRVGAEGKAYFTPDRYASAAEAQRRLALPTRPEGYFEVPFSRLRDPSPFTRVPPGPRGSGGGLECIVTCPTDVSGLPFRRIP